MPLLIQAYEVHTHEGDQGEEGESKHVYAVSEPSVVDAGVGFLTLANVLILRQWSSGPSPVPACLHLTSPMQCCPKVDFLHPDCPELWLLQRMRFLGWRNVVARPWHRGGDQIN